MTFKQRLNPGRLTFIDSFTVSFIVCLFIAFLGLIFSWTLKGTIISGFIFSIVVLFLILLCEDLDGDTKEEVTKTEKKVITKYGFKFEADVPKKIKKFVYHDGDWREILGEGVKLEKDKKGK
jgi:hypothetical protein